MDHTHPDKLLRITPPLADNSRSRDVEESSFTFRSDSFCQHCLPSTCKEVEEVRGEGGPEEERGGGGEGEG